MSGNDTDATVSFDRASITGTGSWLPSGSETYDHHAVAARILKMNSDSVERIGAFSCMADKNGVQEIITTIIMTQYSK